MASNLTQNNILELEAAVENAVQNNPNLAKMQAKYKALAEIPSQAGSFPDPMLMLNAMNLPTDTFTVKQEPMTQMQIGISQAFPFPGKLGLRRKTSEYEALASNYSANELRLQIINHVKQSWWQTFFLDRAIEVVHSNQELLRQLIEVAQKKYEVGKGLQQDVLLAQLELSKLLDHEIQLTSFRRHEAIKLNVLMDVSPENTIILPLKMSDYISSIKSESTLYEIAEISRSALLAQKKLVDAAKTKLNLAKKDLYPDFKLGLTYGARSGENPPPKGGQRSDFVSIMLSANMPIYANTKQSKAVCQKTQELMGSKYEMQDELIRVRAEISGALADFEQAKQQYLLFKTGIIPQAQQTVSSMLSAYQVNKVDFLNLVHTQMTLFNYELQYWKSFVDSKKAIAKLEAATGQENIHAE